MHGTSAEFAPEEITVTGLIHLSENEIEARDFRHEYESTIGRHAYASRAGLNPVNVGAMVEAI